MSVLQVRAFKIFLVNCDYFVIPENGAQRHACEVSYEAFRIEYSNKRAIDQIMTAKLTFDNEYFPIINASMSPSTPKNETLAVSKKYIELMANFVLVREKLVAATNARFRALNLLPR